MINAFKIVFLGAMLALHATSVSGSAIPENVSTAIQASFDEAVEQVRAFPKEDHLPESEKKVTLENRLKMYALFKQATEGDCPEETPENNPTAILKHEAWIKEMGLTKPQAMMTYILTFADIKKAVLGTQN